MNKAKVKVIVKRVLIGLVVVLVGIQFVHPARNINSTITPDDFNQLYPIPDSVQVVLKKACYDCHSNNTRYPWYFNIQPVAWWMSDHVDEGKKELNFSEFGKRPLAKRAKKIKKIAKEVQDGDMPLSSYTWIHKDAMLSEGEKQLVINWANDLAQKISAQQGDGK
jgi:hypothetical protein